MNSLKYIIDENNKLKTDSILIVDKEGCIGAEIYERIKDEVLVVLAGGKKPQSTHNIIYLPYKKIIPVIPEGAYSLFLMIADSEKDLLDIAIQIIKKANQNNAKFILIYRKEKYDDDVVNKILLLYEKSHVIVLGNLVFEDTANKHFSPIDSILFDSGFSGRIHLSNMGMRKLNPILFDDAITYILQTVFGIQDQPKRALIYPKDFITELTIAHEIQKIDPLVKIDFLESEEKPILETDTNISGFNALQDDYAIKNKIIELYLQIIQLRGKHSSYISPSDTAIENFQNINKNKKIISRGRIYFFLYILLTIFLFPFFIAFISSALGIYFLIESKHDLQNIDIQKAQKHINNAILGFHFETIAMKIVEIEFAIIGQNTPIQRLSNKLEIAGNLSNMLESSIRDLSNINMIINGRSLDPKKDLKVALQSLQNNLINFESIELSGDLTENEKKQFVNLNVDISMVSRIINLIPHLIGLDGKKTYLILFQNNTELRPGGGFIGSYALLNVDKGQIKDFTVHNSYDADGQLKNHIEPPFAIRRYLPQGNLYLRDSNFDIDFSQGAKITAFMLQQETGIKPDGVIGIDLFFIKNLLDVIGPVYIPEYGVTVNADTFYTQIEKHAEQNFFPGSTQKQDFLKSLFSSILQKLQTRKDFSFFSFLKQVPDIINKKHLLFEVSDFLYQQQLSVNSFSSSLVDFRQNDSGVINDFMGINDANLGANKSNYFLSRAISHHVTFDKSGTIQDTVSIAYTNKSQLGVWPGGDYRNYLRIILPINSTLLDVAIDKDRQNFVNAVTEPQVYENIGFKPPNGLEVEKTIEQGKDIYGFFVTVPAGVTRTITISYELAQKSNFAYPAVSYNLKLFKQPGTDNDTYSFTFNYPDEYKTFDSTSGMINKGNQSFFRTNLDTDHMLLVDLAKK